MQRGSGSGLGSGLTVADLLTARLESKIPAAEGGASSRFGAILEDQEDEGVRNVTLDGIQYTAYRGSYGGF